MGNFINQLENFGFGAAGQLVGAGIGALTANSNDARQLKQQQALQNMQVTSQEELSSFNEQKQLDLWNQTNAPAQIAQYEKAGLNPALMYGGGGGGGSTISSLNTGNVTGATAQQNPGEIQAGEQMGLQLANMSQQNALLGAQKQNIEADTANKQADTKNKPLTGENIQADTSNKLQGLDNLRESYELTRLQEAMQQLQNYKEATSQGDQLQTINYERQAALKNLQILNNNKTISDQTVQDNIKIIQQQALEAVLKNSLVQANVENTKADTILKDQNVKTQLQQLAQGWQQLDINAKAQAVQRFTATIQANMPGVSQALGKILNDGIESIFKLTGQDRGFHNQPKGQ